MDFINNSMVAKGVDLLLLILIVGIFSISVYE